MMLISRHRIDTLSQKLVEQGRVVTNLSKVGHIWHCRELRLGCGSAVNNRPSGRAPTTMNAWRAIELGRVGPDRRPRRWGGDSHARAQAQLQGESRLRGTAEIGSRSSARRWNALLRLGHIGQSLRQVRPEPTVATHGAHQGTRFFPDAASIFDRGQSYRRAANGGSTSARPSMRSDAG